MKFYETQEFHNKVATYLHERYAAVKPAIEGRLYEYVHGVVMNPEAHNLFELLSVVKFLRLWESYDFNEDWFHAVVSLETVLEFKKSESIGNVTLSPVQVFHMANIYGFQKKVTEEKVVPVADEKGNVSLQKQTVSDIRRLVTTVIIFIPRKFGKTTEMVFFAIDDFLFGDDDAQIYCCSNSDKQSKILFDFIKFSLQRLDRKKKYFRLTMNEANWKENAQKTTGKTSLINSLSGGAETKDGLKASLRFRDEFGASKYVNGHSDAAKLGNVIDSSMGTRKQPLSIDITTAGRVLDGPFQEDLEGAKFALLAEFPCDETSDMKRNDYQFAHIFQPDGWEMGEECMDNPTLWQKVQPHLGYTVRSNFYADELAKAKTSPQAFIEFNTKLLNKFMSDQVEEWINAQKIMNLQGSRRIDQLEEGEWECYIGMDFSKGDDLCEMTYLCYNPYKKCYYLDADAWITEETFNKAAKSPLYHRWAEKGEIHISPGATIDENLMIERLEEIRQYVKIKKIGYDRYSSLRFVNAITAWLYDLGLPPREIGETVIGISQLNSVFNAACEELLYIVNQTPAILEVSPNPVIPWCFGNCYLEVDGMGNKKPQKALRTGKIDIVIGALEGLIMQAQEE